MGIGLFILPVTSHQSPVTSHQSPVPSHQSPVPSHQSPVPSPQSPHTTLKLKFRLAQLFTFNT
ncbi:hypothetical protein H6F47_06865 [Sphaerospermopsis sp. FACHB-1094]|uniref:hypothetical protein n=1 Tax=Sphaerospermopsis sp. FACHB-1094 TaxID=2692861 RepID=UPI001688C6F1|nr:hypothetical protein [Sphaerospermopsis sp. FACHB-1094]MBD2132166.1 hypothetical protein [Sphaerospermopsis sp. FACHB-1094]